MWSFFEFQNKWRTRHSKEGGYGALNPYTNTSMLGLKSLIWFIINSSMTFYLYHADNVVLWSFFQIQNNWRPRKLKQRRNKALNLDTNSSMLCLKIRIDSIIISSMIFYLYREDNCQTFIKFYFNKLSVYKTGTIHNLMHNPIRFQSPDQECSLAFRLIASSFVCARIALQEQCQVVLCVAQWSGARSPHWGADLLPSVRRFSKVFLVPFHLGLVWYSIFLLDFRTSE